MRVPKAPKSTMVMMLRKNCFFLTWKLRKEKHAMLIKKGYYQIIKIVVNLQISKLNVITPSDGLDNESV